MKLKSNSSSFLFVAMLLSCSASSAATAPVIDVSNPPFVTNLQSLTGATAVEFQQSFSSGVTGMLSGMTIYAANGLAPVQLQVRVGQTSSYYLGNEWQADLMQASKISGTYFDLSMFGIAVNAGERITFELKSKAGGFAMGRAGSNFGGGMRMYIPRHNKETGRSDSIAFQSFVTPLSAVPEPQTYGMMLGGIGIVGFMARRRKL